MVCASAATFCDGGSDPGSASLSSSTPGIAVDGRENALTPFIVARCSFPEGVALPSSIIPASRGRRGTRADVGALDKHHLKLVGHWVLARHQQVGRVIRAVLTQLAAPSQACATARIERCSRLWVERDGTLVGEARVQLAQVARLAHLSEVWVRPALVGQPDFLCRPFFWQVFHVALRPR